MNKITVNSKWLLPGLLCACAAAICVSACGCLPSSEADPQPTQPVLQQEQPEISSEEKAAMVAGRITSDIPACYLAAGHAVQSSSDISVSGADSVPFGSGMTDVEMVHSVALSMLDETRSVCLALADGDTAAVDSEYAHLVSELDACTDLTALRDVIAQMDSRMFRTVAIDPAAEGAKLKTALYGYTDEEGQMWLCVYANSPLPGLKDAQRGYSLSVFMKSSKTSVSADSLYSTGSIRYINEYAVRFRLADILAGEITPEELVAGNNRIIFTLFSLDNTISLANEYYKWRAPESLAADPLAARSSLVRIISEFE